MARDFLLEIGVEEMPARFMSPALEQLKEFAATTFDENRLYYEEIHSLGTPRRLTLFVRGLSEQQEPLKEEVKGPAKKVAYKDGEPTKAAHGFAKSQGVDISDLILKTVRHVEYVFAEKKEEGKQTQDLLTEIIPDLISRLHFPKSMRWGDLEFRFARPIRWLVSLYGEVVIPFELAGVQSGRKSYGHRFLSARTVEIKKPADYLALMEQEYVLAEPEERKENIKKQIKSLAGEIEGKVITDEDLLEEVNNLVEYPAALCGSYDRAYLEMPPEVLVTTMKEHQRFFPVEDGKGNLLPRFIAVSNGGNLEVVRAGNEKVLRARLDDASFFWEEDLRSPLDLRVEHLKKVMFQESLGTVYQKVQRISYLAEYIIKIISDKDEDFNVTKRAAFIAKADLVTNMVYEFPELQGIMGREYALKSGENPAVARAIFEHYLPRHAGDDLPQSLPGIALSLADKFDTLVGCFSIGMQPTGSQDPYALRRQAMGICHIMLNLKPGISLQNIFSQAYEKLRETSELSKNEIEIKEILDEFFRQRLRGIMREFGMAYDIVEAVLKPELDDPVDIYLRGEVLAEFRKKQEFEDLITAYNRVSNLGRKATSTVVREDLLESHAERELYEFFVKLKQKVQASIQERSYFKALEDLSKLKQPVDHYFDQVMVMINDEKVRDNRLALLHDITRLMETVADLSKIVVEKDS